MPMPPAAPLARNACDRPAVPEQLVVDRGGGLVDVADPRGVRTPPVADVGGRLRLVDRQPRGVDVPQRLEHDRRVLPEPVRRVAHRPAAGVLQRLRQVPVVERDRRVDPPRQQPVDQPPVEVDPGLVDVAGARRLDARPRHREPVGGQPEVRDQVEVRLPQAVVVGRRVARRPSPIRPGVAANVSQIDGPRPSAVVEPSTWNADVAAPHTNPAGNAMGSAGGCHPVRRRASASRSPARRTCRPRALRRRRRRHRAAGPCGGSAERAWLSSSSVVGSVPTAHSRSPRPSAAPVSAGAADAGHGVLVGDGDGTGPPRRWPPPGGRRAPAPSRTATAASSRWIPPAAPADPSSS